MSLPFANVNVFVPVNVVRVSIVALNSKSVFFVLNPPAEKKITTLAGCKVSPLEDTTANSLSPAFDPVMLRVGND